MYSKMKLHLLLQAMIIFLLPAMGASQETSNSEVLGQPMDSQWWKTSEYLYSPSDSLFYRDDRYFEKRSENGKKIF